MLPPRTAGALPAAVQMPATVQAGGAVLLPLLEPDVPAAPDAVQLRVLLIGMLGVQVQGAGAEPATARE